MVQVERSFSVIPLTRLQLIKEAFRAVPTDRLLQVAEKTLAVLKSRAASESVRLLLEDVEKGVQDRNQLLFDRIRLQRVMLETLIPHAEDLASEAGFDDKVRFLRERVRAFQIPVLFEDDLIQDKWEILNAGGTAMAGFGPTLFDPVGDMSMGAVSFLHRRGDEATWRQGLKVDPDFRPPPSFGLLSRESPARIVAANGGQTKKMGNVLFKFDSALQIAIVPREHAPVLRSKIELQYVIPTADILPSYFTEEWASRLPDEVVLATSIKGLTPEGQTPREYMYDVLKKVGRYEGDRAVPIVLILGFAPSDFWMKEQRNIILEERLPSSPSWDLVLASTNKAKAVELAKRWAGPDHLLSTMTYEGIDLTVVENKNFLPPLRLVVVSDEDVIRANELASIYKNLQAVHLGGSLFRKMLEFVRLGVRRDEDLELKLSMFYGEQMQKAATEIRRVLALEKIPKEKAVILPEVQRDLIGSWTTKAFGDLYDLVNGIFGSKVDSEERFEAMMRLKKSIGSYYTVRNPRYGFCLAADREAAMQGIGMNQHQVDLTLGRLQARGISTEGLEPEQRASTHYFFSMKPEGLEPEGLWVAERLPERFPGDEFRRLPQSFRDTHRDVEKMRHETYFALDAQRKITDLLHEMSQLVPWSAATTHENFLRLAEQVDQEFRRALGILSAMEHGYPQSRRTLIFLEQLTKRTDVILRRLRERDPLGADQISLLNQAVLEAMTRSNLLYFLPDQEKKKETRYLYRKLANIARYVDGDNPPQDIFSSSSRPPSMDLSLAKKLVALRREIFEDIGVGLILLTHEMSMKFHEERVQIGKKDIQKDLGEMVDYLEKSAESIMSDAEVRDFFTHLKKVLINIRERLQQKRTEANERRLIYQSMIEALIHARRFVVLPENQAGEELNYAVKRFEKILEFVEGKNRSPLWHFG